MYTAAVPPKNTVTLLTDFRAFVSLAKSESVYPYAVVDECDSFGMTISWVSCSGIGGDTLIKFLFGQDCQNCSPSVIVALKYLKTFLTAS